LGHSNSIKISPIRGFIIKRKEGMKINTKRGLKIDEITAIKLLKVDKSK
jgi:hypothetical protein